jgi:hypothetical protein
MANTTNFNWETPDDTDLVKDGAAAIRTLGSAIDTSLVDLKGGTTDQVLAKNSNTDMDFKWVTSDDANAIQNAIVDAKGDIIAASANDTPARLAVGTNDYRLVAASGETTGLKYVADTQNTVVDAEGDLLVGDAADTLQRLAVGTTGQVLTVDTTVDGKIKWAAAGGSSGPAFSAFRNTSNQTFSASTWTKVQLNAEDFDTDACFDPTTNYRFTPTTAGKYQFNVGLNIQASSTARIIVALYKNGAVLLRLFDLSVATGALVGGSALVDMNGSSDYIELYVYSEGTSPYISNRSGGAGTTLSGTWIRS